MTKRYRVKKFVVSEGSFVDRPAQGGAKVVFMKRAGDVDVDLSSLFKMRDGEPFDSFVKRFSGSDEAREAFPDATQRITAAALAFDEQAFGKSYVEAVPVMTDAVDGHSHLLWIGRDRGGTTSYGTAPEEEHSHDHPWSIMQDGEVVIGENDGHSHTVNAGSLQAAMRELIMEVSEAPTVIADIVLSSASEAVIIDVSKMTADEVIEKVVSGEIAMRTGAGEVIGKSSMTDGAFAIRNEHDLTTAIAVAGDIPQADVVRHIIKRARVLGLEGEPKLAEFIKSNARPAGDPTPEAGQMTEKSKGAGETVAKADHEKVVAERDLAKREATLTDSQRAHYNDIEGDAATAFLAKSSEERDAELNEITKGDPVVYTSDDGTEFRKSDDARMVKMAKERDADRKELRLAKADREQAAFEKRAVEETAHFTGEVSDRAALIKAVDGIEDAEVSKRVHEMLKAADSACSNLFKRNGSSKGGPTESGGSANEELQSKADDIAKAEGFKGTAADAYAKACDVHPELAKRALNEGNKTAAA